MNANRIKHDVGRLVLVQSTPSRVLVVAEDKETSLVATEARRVERAVVHNALAFHNTNEP